MINLTTFTGEVPCAQPHLLPDNAAQFTQDCDFTAVSLAGLGAFEFRQTLANTAIRSAFCYANSDNGPLQVRYYGWQTDADAVRGPIADDAYDRMYWTAGPDYNIRVTRDANLGASSEPDPNKTWLAGVPAPTVAPNTNGDGIYYNGSEITDIVAICETPSGSVLSAESVKDRVTVRVNTTGNYEADIDYSPSCKIYSASVGATVTTLPDGFVPSGNEEIWSAEPLAINNIIYPNVKKFTPNGSKLFEAVQFKQGQTTFIRYNDWEYAPLANKLYALRFQDTTFAYNWDANTNWDQSMPQTTNLLTGRECVGYTIYHYVGNGWYASSSSATPPGGTNANGSTFAIQVHFGNEYVTLRESISRSTFRLAGYSGEFVYASGKVSLRISATESNEYLEQRVYAYTYVNIFGEEGPLSPVAELAVAEGAKVSLTFTGLSSTPYAPIAKLRLYRSATGTSGTTLLFHSEHENASTVEVDDYKLAAELGEEVTSSKYFPPEPGLRGLTALPNGILVAYKDNEIHFSEPYLPYAWNPENVMPVQDTVVSICAAEGGFYVTTRSVPYFFSGLTPDAMSSMKIDAVQAGVSKGSIVNIGPAVLWATNDGIVSARGGQVSLDWSYKFFTRRVWRERYGDRLAQMRFSGHDGHLIVWFEDGTPGFSIRFDETAPAFTRLLRGMYAACVDPNRDELLFCLNGRDLFAYNAGARGEFVWHSKDFILPKPISFGAVQVVGEGRVTVECIAEGVVSFTKTLDIDNTGRSVFRLPGFKTCRRWSFKLSGDGLVEQLLVAVSPSEFRNG